MSGQRYKHFFENNISRGKNSDYIYKIDKLTKSNYYHPELAAPFVTHVKEDYKGGGSQSISVSCHLQEYTDFNIDKSNVGVETPTYFNFSRNVEQVCPTYNNILLNTKERSIIGQCLRQYSPRRIAFTLAEVLITLGIIGVVAAMTLPSLVANYKEKQRVTQLKKSYSVLQQAYLRAVEKYGDSKYWDLTPTETGEIDENGEQILDYSGSQKILGYLAENLNTQKTNETLKYKIYTLDGREIESKDKPPEEYVYLNDNSILVAGWTNLNTSNNMDFAIIFPECIKKGGCKVGVDLFYFKLYFDKGFIPTGTQSVLLRDQAHNFELACNRKSTQDNNGRACTAWVIFNENMDYLHCDDLSWSGKHKCK